MDEMSLPAEIDWEQIRRDYEAGLMTINTLGRAHGVTRGQIDGRARRAKWHRPGGAQHDRQILIHKLMTLLERQLDGLGQKMNENNTLESKVLSDIVRDLDRLIAIEKAEIGSGGGARENGEMTALRIKLEARINAITKKA